jgi:hypothetical protein
VRRTEGLEHAFGGPQGGAKPPGLERSESSAERGRALGDEYREAGLRLYDVTAPEAEIRLPLVQILFGAVANDNVVLETTVLTRLKAPDFTKRHRTLPHLSERKIKR